MHVYISKLVELLAITNQRTEKNTIYFIYKTKLWCKNDSNTTSLKVVKLPK